MNQVDFTFWPVDAEMEQPFMTTAGIFGFAAMVVNACTGYGVVHGHVFVMLLPFLYHGVFYWSGAHFYGWYATIGVIVYQHFVTRIRGDPWIAFLLSVVQDYLLFVAVCLCFPSLRWMCPVLFMVIVYRMHITIRFIVVEEAFHAMAMEPVQAPRVP